MLENGQAKDNQEKIKISAFNPGVSIISPNKVKKSVKIVEKKEAITANEELSKSLQKPFRSKQMFPYADENVEPKFEKVFISDLKTCSLPLGKIKVIIRNGDIDHKMFYCAEANDQLHETMQNIESKIYSFVKTDKTERYIPEIDEVVLAFYEGSFFRAVCLDKKVDTFEIFFVDYGNHKTATAAEIKPLPPNLKQQILITQIYLENFPKVILHEVSEMLNDEKGLDVEILKIDDETGCSFAKICDI
jgi:Tudor domain